jgi:hypothetical protein
MPNSNVTAASDREVECLPGRKMRSVLEMVEASPILNDEQIRESEMCPGVQKTHFRLLAEFNEHSRHLPGNRQPFPDLDWLVDAHANQKYDEVATDPRHHALRNHVIHG